MRARKTRSACSVVVVGWLAIPGLDRIEDIVDRKWKVSLLDRVGATPTDVELPAATPTIAEYQLSWLGRFHDRIEVLGRKL